MKNDAISLRNPTEKSFADKFRLKIYSSSQKALFDKIIRTSHPRRGSDFNIAKSADFFHGRIDQNI